jgi:hypothetical protein
MLTQGLQGGQAASCGLQMAGVMVKAIQPVPLVHPLGQVTVLSHVLHQELLPAALCWLWLSYHKMASVVLQILQECQVKMGYGLSMAGQPPHLLLLHSLLWPI